MSKLDVRTRWIELLELEEMLRRKARGALNRLPVGDAEIEMSL
jgi:hypothetical protein